MPSTTNYNFGDVVVVPFPFTNQTASKKRPAVVVSSALYNQERPDLIIMAVTSQPAPTDAFGETSVSYWKEAGLLKPSVLKPIIASIEKTMVIQTMGRLSPSDQRNLQRVLDAIIHF